MVVEDVMDTYLELGFITNYQYMDFCKMKSNLEKTDMDEKSIFQKFYEYIDILPMECEMVDMLTKTIQGNAERIRLERLKGDYIEYILQ